MVRTDSKVKIIKCKMIVGGRDVVFQVDPGATVNMLPVKYADKVVPESRTLKMWNDSELKTLGKCRTNHEIKRNKRETHEIKGSIQLSSLCMTVITLLSLVSERVKQWVL